MPLTLDRLVANAASLDDGAAVSAYIRASDGTLIDATSNALHVNIQNTSLDIVNTEFVAGDAAATVGSEGPYILGIRQDAAGSPVSADGDYHPLIFNNDGELKVAADLASSVADDAADSGNPIKIGGVAQDMATALSVLSAAGDRGDLTMDLHRRLIVNDASNIGIASTQKDVSTTGALIVTELVGRNKVYIQNTGNKSVYIGASGVTTANGLEIGPNSTFADNLGEAIAIHGVAESGTQDVRIMEVA